MSPHARLELVGAPEIAAMLGVPLADAEQLTDSAAFPAPAAYIGPGPVWRKADVLAWMHTMQ
jgi:hypothetical protein